MGSSAVDAENGGIDETVGSLVWVRRRNGSWWPGQIISVDELPKSCLLAAKPGTPVKLLGRDDASFDWYNLNKSKRVKVFRCGEFDNCIEKAKASVSTNKKSVKYARREDAIICALEIENSYEFNNKVNLWVNSSSKLPNGNLLTKSLAIDENRNAEDRLCAPLKKRKVVQQVNHLGVSSAKIDELSSVKSSFLKGNQRETPNDSEDDVILGVKRMRGIKDLVFDVASKIKDEVEEEDEHVNQEIADKWNCIASETLANSDKSSTPSLKKNRSSVAISNGHESKRRKDRRRTLTRVLEESVMVSVPVVCNELSVTVGSQLMAISERDAAVESFELEGITPDYTNNCADETDIQCENGILSNCLDVPCNPLCGDNNHKVNGSAGDLLAFDEESLDDLYDVHVFIDDHDDNAGFTNVFPTSSSGIIPIYCSNLCQPGEHVEDIPVTIGNVLETESTSPAAERDGIHCALLKSSSVWQSKRKRNSRTNHKKSDLHSITGGFNNGSRYQGLGLEKHLDGFSECADLKIDSKHEELPINTEDGFPNWGKHASSGEKIERAEDELKAPTRSLPYRHSRLVVPSKYEEADFPTRNTRSEQGAEHCLHDVPVEVKAACRSHHVPIVSFMSKFNGKAIVGLPLAVGSVDNGWCEKVGKQSAHDGKHGSGVGRGPRKQFGKGLLKNGLPSSKKTKRLSALSVSKSRDREGVRYPVAKKPLSSAIASCIPLNVVFSRLNEAVNG